MSARPYCLILVCPPLAGLCPMSCVPNPASSPVGLSRQPYCSHSARKFVGGVVSAASTPTQCALDCTDTSCSPPFGEVYQRSFPSSGLPASVKACSPSEFRQLPTMLALWSSVPLKKACCCVKYARTPQVNSALLILVGSLQRARTLDALELLVWLCFYFAIT